MLILKRARVPIALLPASLGSPLPDPVEPAVLCDIALQGSRMTGVRRHGTTSPFAPEGLRSAFSSSSTPFSASPSTPFGNEPAPGAREAASSPTLLFPTGASAPPVSASPAASDRPAAQDEVIDLDGRLVLPGLVDAHTHLDKAHTWDRAPNRTGTFLDALETLNRDRDRWTASDLRRRAGFALRCAWEHGTRVVRTHVDTGLPWAETSHAVMAELREAWREKIVLQTVPLCGLAAYSGPDGEAIADLALKYGASALGGWSLISPELPGHLDRLMAIARERRVGLDLHVDENGDPKAEVLRAVAEAVLRNAFPDPVVCGHCCSLAVQAPERQRSTIGLVREAGLGVISLPLCNLYLQDRRGSSFPRTPYWRGVTLIQDFLDAGVPVACASDNVRDAFYAFGDLDLLEVYTQSVRLAHLESRLAESVRIVAATAADLVGLPDFGRVTAGAPAHLSVLAARSFSELLSRPAAPRHLVDGETLREAEIPSYEKLR